MEYLNNYIPGTSHLVDYAIEQLGAEVINVEILPEKRPPFPCLTGVSNTSDNSKIDKNKYPNILAAGVDTLELNYGVAGYRYPDMFTKINDAKLEAVSAGYKGLKGESIELFGQEFMVQARGSKGGYEYLLQNGDVELQIMPEARGGRPSPELRVIFRSPYLWRVGEIQSYNQVIEYLNEWVFLEYCNVSRADLCVDMMMALPEIDRKNQILTRLREKNLYYGGDYQRGQRKTGYQFGRGGITCRFYDKAYEIEVKGKGHIIPLWIKNGWDKETKVSRLELQLRREGLRRFDKDMDFVTFQNIKSDIWAYITGEYIRIIDPESSTRKERAKVMDYWRDYQECIELFGERQGILPYKQLDLDWKQLVSQAKGCMSSAFARLAADVGEREASIILEQEWKCKIPKVVFEKGILKKSRYMHFS